MNSVIRSNSRRRERGQTIIVAMIVLGLLLILGFVFLGIINKSIRTSGFMRSRGVANDLSEAGIRYAHGQLLTSAQGADWRGQPTMPIDASAGNPVPEETVDPDAFYLRPPATVGNLPVLWPNSNYVDQGGPDGLGPFFRVQFRDGRALVRVRYAPSDADIFRTSPTGALRKPGALRNYIMLESVGRNGVLDANDPTAVLGRTPRRIRNYGSPADFLSALSLLRGDQAGTGGIQVNRAFASIGIIETARFITDKYHLSRPADLGNTPDNGAFYRNQGDVSDLPMQLGTALPLLSFNSNNVTSASAIGLGGSLFSNADVMLHGAIVANLNMNLGDEFDVAGNISGDGSASLDLRLFNWNTTSGQWQRLNPVGSALGAQAFSSASPTFNGEFALRDGNPGRDLSNNVRGVGHKDPPTAFSIDSQTKTNRYLQMTRSSGILIGSNDIGQFGQGAGIYVDNFGDSQGAADELGRANSGGESSLINDWLNPSSATGSHWKGYLYTPPAAYVYFTEDGFTITRDATEPKEMTWRRADGTDSGLAEIRYRIGRGTDRRLHIVNTLNVTDINKLNMAQTDYQNGPEFNGVLYFEGNVRTRGVIPTDVQITLVSRGTIYVEGSILKGVTGNHWTSTYSTAQDNMSATAEGQRLTRPTKSMLMLIARDYVAINTTQFFGVAPGQEVEPKEDIPNLPSYNPIRVSNGKTLRFLLDLALDPGTVLGSPSNPNTWRSYASGYGTSPATTDRLWTKLLISHAQDNGAGEAAFIGASVNGSDYLFPQLPTLADAQPWTDGTTNNNNALGPYSNGAAFAFPAAPAGTPLPLYGLGGEEFQTFGRFESMALPFIAGNPANPGASETATGITSTGTYGSYPLATQSANLLEIRPQTAGKSTNDYILGRLALAPYDVRIEASMFAEDGSFFVIPGPWFNPNPNDNYASWFEKSGSGANPEAGNLWRKETWGAGPDMPFFGEPLDVRVVISGAISENMPATASQQAEWFRKWGWIPKRQGAATKDTIPYQHLPNDPALASLPYVPNLIFAYDPVLATGRRFGFYDPTAMGNANLNDPGTYVRSRWIDYNLDGIQQITELVPLPPLPRLPVSPTLAYFGEVH